MKTKSGKKTGSFLVALGSLLLGGIIGAGFGVLVAPRSGKNTRRLIRRKSTRIKDRTIDGLVDSRDQALESLHSLAEETRDRADAVTARGKKLVERQKTNAQEKIGAIR